MYSRKLLHRKIQQPDILNLPRLDWLDIIHLCSYIYYYKGRVRLGSQTKSKRWRKFSSCTISRSWILPSLFNMYKTVLCKWEVHTAGEALVLALTPWAIKKSLCPLQSCLGSFTVTTYGGPRQMRSGPAWSPGPSSGHTRGQPYLGGTCFPPTFFTLSECCGCLSENPATHTFLLGKRWSQVFHCGTAGFIVSQSSSPMAWLGHAVHWFFVLWLKAALIPFWHGWVSGPKLTILH